MLPVDALSVWQWVVLATIPLAIVLLYFLKLRRTPRPVPSTMLWMRAIEDLRANSIWQRLRIGPLLVLQLLVVGLVGLTLVRPGWTSGPLAGRRLILLIDTSASMSASDVSPTRLMDAKRRARNLVAEMQPGDMATVISFSDVAHVEQSFTDNRHQLESSLTAIRPTNRTTSLAEALRVATGLTARTRTAADADSPRVEESPASVFLFSDGAFPVVDSGLLANLQLTFVPIGTPEARNIGITAFVAQSGSESQTGLRVFAKIENAGPEAEASGAALYRGDTLIDNKRIEVPARGSAGLEFELEGLESDELRCVVERGGALALDDQAWIAIDPPVRRNVLLVTPGADALELALGTPRARELAMVEVARPDVLATEEYQRKASQGSYALVIYDRCRPTEMPQANTLFVGALPPGNVWRTKAAASAPQIIDSESSHPLLQLVDLSDVNFASATPLEIPPGARALVTTDAGTLLAIAPREQFQDVVLGTELTSATAEKAATSNTNWPLRLSFPTFVLNLLGYLAHTADSRSLVISPGQPIPLAEYTGASELSITVPSGRTETLTMSRGQAFHFSATEELGVYRVRAAGYPERRVSVDLLSSLETNIASREQIQIGAAEISGQARWEGNRREMWKLLLLGALGVLAAEWYIYIRSG
ncbi:MAG TPA: BatA and WFA domain-containing protein [Pirellulales bacterium]